MTVEAVEDNVFEGDGLDRVELIGEPLCSERETALDDAVAGKAGEVDIHAARVDRACSASHAPNVRLRPGPYPGFAWKAAPPVSACGVVAPCQGRSGSVAQGNTT